MNFLFVILMGVMPARAADLSCERLFPSLADLGVNPESHRTTNFRDDETFVTFLNTRTLEFFDLVGLVSVVETKMSGPKPSSIARADVFQRALLKDVAPEQHERLLTSLGQVLLLARLVPEESVRLRDQEDWMFQLTRMIETFSRPTRLNRGHHPKFYSKPLAAAIARFFEPPTLVELAKASRSYRRSFLQSQLWRQEQNAAEPGQEGALLAARLCRQALQMPAWNSELEKIFELFSRACPPKSDCHTMAMIDLIEPLLHQLIKHHHIPDAALVLGLSQALEQEQKVEDPRVRNFITYVIVDALAEELPTAVEVIEYFKDYRKQEAERLKQASFQGLN